MVLEFLTITSYSQTTDYVFVKDNSIIVKDSSGNAFSFPFAGGMSNSQFSAIDLNLDGIKDLIVFDKIGNRLSCFINLGINDSVSYIYAPEYNICFPEIKSWIQLIDYKNDGKEDIFTYSNGGIKVYKNASVSSLNFDLIKEPILSSYNGNYTNLFCLSEDYPAISDIDNDGDVDILNFWVLGKFVNYHKNLSIEKYGIADSLDFQLTDESWGCFAEDEGSNLLLLDTCLTNNKSVQKKNFKHSGSTLLAEDFNGDGLKDLVIGDVDYANLIKLTNSGTLTKAKMLSQDTLFPNINKPVSLYSFPLANYLDVNNDGKKDLLVSSFDPGLTTAESYKSNWYYKNIGINTLPAFQFQQPDFLQKEMLDFGTGAYPVLYDIDNDGLKDLFVGNIGYRDTSFMQAGFLQSVFISKLAYFKNEGSITNPVFKLITRDFANISALDLFAVYPTFADINNDGKAEMIIGNSDGKLLLFTNNSTVSNPVFVLSQTNFQNIDVGDYSSPQLFDLNKDGLFDLIIGERQHFWKDAANNITARKGNLNYFKNTGTANNPFFTLITDSLGGVDVTNYDASNYGYSTPCFFRTNNNETRLFAGNENGNILYYKNIDNNLNYNFLLTDTLSFIQSVSKFKIDEGTRTSIAVSDINNDNYPDIFIGNAAGGISFFKGSPLNTAIPEEYTNENIEYEAYPNPCDEFITIKNNNSSAKITSVEILNIIGQKIFSLNNLTSKEISIVTKNFENGFYNLIINYSIVNLQLNQIIIKKIIINH